MFKHWCFNKFIFSRPFAFFGLLSFSVTFIQAVNYSQGLDSVEICQKFQPDWKLKCEPECHQKGFHGKVMEKTVKLKNLLCKAKGRKDSFNVQ